MQTDRAADNDLPLDQLSEEQIRDFIDHVKKIREDRLAAGGVGGLNGFLPSYVPPPERQPPAALSMDFNPYGDPIRVEILDLNDGEAILTSCLDGGWKEIGRGKVTRAGVLKTPLLPLLDRQCFGSILRHVRREAVDPAYAAQVRKDSEAYLKRMEEAFEAGRRSAGIKPSARSRRSCSRSAT